MMISLFVMRLLTLSDRGYKVYTKPAIRKVSKRQKKSCLILYS
jgi:hypothetical protein